jgi:hypothetical protein
VLAHFYVGPVLAQFYVGPGPARYNKKYVFEKKIVMFSRIFLSILVNIDLYFYTIKIQIWY